MPMRCARGPLLLTLLLACNPAADDTTGDTASTTAATGTTPTTGTTAEVSTGDAPTTTGQASATTGDPSLATSTGDITTTADTTTAASTGDTTTGDTTTGGVAAFNWYPGYYLLARPDNFDKVLAYPKIGPFEGVHMRYYWADWEIAPMDYAPGLAQLDKDIAAVKKQGKKLLVFLNYEKSDGTPCVPPDLLEGPGAWCSGGFCGQLPNNGAALPIYWNDAVVARMRGWLEAMAAHLEDHPDRDLIAGITLPETATGDYTLAELEATGYTPDKYLASVEGTVGGLLDAAPSLIVFQYINGGFKPTPAEYFLKLADWALEHPGAGFGIPDLVPNIPKPTAADGVLRSAKYQGRLPFNPDVQAPDYGLDRTPSLAATLALALSPAPDGMLAGYVSFAFTPGPGPNAFTLDEVAAAIPDNPTNQAMPTW